MFHKAKGTVIDLLLFKGSKDLSISTVWFLIKAFRPINRPGEKIYIYKHHCRFVCLSVCLFGFANLFRLKSDRHETRHVGRTSRHPGRFSYYILIHSYDSFMSLNVLEKICLFVMLHLFPHWNIILLTQCMVCLMIINVSMVHKIIAKRITFLEHRKY